MIGISFRTPAAGCQGSEKQISGDWPAAGWIAPTVAPKSAPHERHSPVIIEVGDQRIHSCTLRATAPGRRSCFCMAGLAR